MSDTFSPYVITALTDVITGGPGNDSTPAIGIYRSGPKIEKFFMDCGLDMRIGSSSRVPATMNFLRDMAARWDGKDAIKHVLLKVCDPREYLTEPDAAERARDHVNRALEPDSLAVTIVGGKAFLTERHTPGTIVQPFITKISRLDFDTVQIETARALTNAATDPEDAVTAACSIIEAVCRSILVELGLPLPAKRDIDGLIRAVQDPLRLSPGRTDLPAEVEQDVRQILGGLTSVSKGVGALRTHGGDAHGRERGYKRIDARIARLAINAASSIALFLIETWERNERKPLPTHPEGS